MISNVFLDEIDSISCIRGSESSIADQRLTNQLLIERDNINNSQLAVFVIAATNLPWQIDDAVTRRLSRNICIKKIYVYQKYMYTNARSYCYTYFIHIFRERRLVNASSQRNICIPMPDHAARSSMFSAAKCVAVCCSVLQCVAVCCSVLQCVAVCCSVLQCVAVPEAPCFLQHSLTFAHLTRSRFFRSRPTISRDLIFQTLTTVSSSCHYIFCTFAKKSWFQYCLEKNLPSASAQIHTTHPWALFWK